MANDYISQVTLPNQETYDFKARSLSSLTNSSVLTGTGTAGSFTNNTYYPAKWTFNVGRNPIDGEIITIKIPIVGHDYGVFLSTNNGTTYYPIVCNGTGRLTTHYPVNTYLTLIFESTGSAANMYAVTGQTSSTRVTINGGAWRVINYYDSNSNDTGYYHRRIYPNLKAGTGGIDKYVIIMQLPDGRWSGIVPSSQTTSGSTVTPKATGKTASTNSFLLGHVLVMYANATYAENANVGTYNIWSAHTGLIDARYSFNLENATNKGFVGYKPVYIVGTVTDGLFTLDPTKWWTQTLPSSEDNKVYIYIGDAYDWYRLTFTEDKPIYWYKNGAVCLYSGASSYAINAGSVAWSNVSDRPTNLNQFTNGPGYVTSSGVTTVSTGAGLTGGDITSTGTVKADLTSETKLTNAATDGTETSGRVYPVRLDKNGKLAVNVPWTNVNSGYASASHTHYELATIGDKRSENTTPNTYANRLIFQGLKTNTQINSPYTDNYSYLVGLRGWSDSSGGNSHELAFNGNGIYRRQGATTTWGNWFHILDSNNTSSGTNNEATLTWSTTYTIAKINGTDIKFTTMAKPSYSYSDISSRPTSIKLTGAVTGSVTLGNGENSIATTVNHNHDDRYKIASGVITLGSSTITPVTSVNGHTGDVTIEDLGLSSALRFAGVTTTDMTGGTAANHSWTGTPAGISNYTPKQGDVVINSTKQDEWVCILVSGTTYTWERLGSDTSYKIVQSAVSSATDETSTATRFVHSVTQDTNGVITVKTRPLPTYNNYSHPTGDGNLHVPATGTGNNGKFLKAGSTAGSLSWATLAVADISDISTTYYKLDGSNTGTKLCISTQSAAYTNQIQFMNSTTKKGSIGTDNTGILGLYASSKIVLRPELDASTKGVEITSSAMYPTASIDLGTSAAANRWGTIYAKYIKLLHTQNSSNEVQITYGSTIDFALMVGTGNENHGLYDTKKSDWVLYAGADNKWILNINSINHLNANKVVDGTWPTGTRGVKPTATTTDGNTTYSGGTVGKSILTLGNNKVGGNNAQAVDDNAQGQLNIYSSGSTMASLTAYAGDKTRIYPEEGISLPYNKIGMMFRADSGTYYTYFAYENSGNEALVAATQSSVTSFIFINGESYANVAAARWTKLTGSGASGEGNAPGLQIKQNCVSIGELIPSNTNATYKLNVNGGQTRLNSTAAASSTNLSSQLIVSNSNSTAVALELWRNANASWQIANVSGTLYIRNNWTTAKQNTYSQDGLIIDYNTGNTAIAGTLSVGQTTRNTSYKLYVNGTGYFNGAVTATSFTGNLTGNVTGNVSGSAGSVDWANTGHPDTFPPSSHTHGNINDNGTISTSAAIAANAALVIATATTGTVIKTTLVFDGSTTNKALTPKGTWGSFLTAHGSSYGKIASGAISTTATSISANTATIESKSANEKLTIQAGNKWIETGATNSGTAGSDIITLGHFVPDNAISNLSTTAQTPSFNSTFNIPTISLDEAGHVTGVGNATVKIPALPSSVTPSSHKHGNINNDGTLGSTASYGVATDANKKIIAIDLSVSEPTASGNATTFVTSVTQSSQGQISVSRSTVPDASSTTAGIVKLGAEGGAATYSHTHSYLSSHGPSYGGIQVSAQSTTTTTLAGGTSAVTITATGANETVKFTTKNKWIVVKGSNSSTAGSDEVQFAHVAGVTAKTSYCSTSATASANGGKITVTDIQYDEAGHITSTTDRTITLSQTTYTLSSLGAAASSHTHGNISSTGTISTSAAPLNGDAIVISTSANNGLVKKTTITFDASTTTQYLNKKGAWSTPTDTKNTAGSTATASKIFLVGATSQAANPQTYSTTYVYATDGTLSAKKLSINDGAATPAEKVQLQWNSTDSALEFVFA